MAKDTRIAFRASEELKERLQRASKKVKLGESTLAEAAVEAAIEYIEKNGGIWLPLVVVPHVRENFTEAGETSNAPADGLFSTSTRTSPGEENAKAFSLNENPPPGLQSARKHIRYTAKPRSKKS